MQIGMLVLKRRREEFLLQESFEKRNVELQEFDIREIKFFLGQPDSNDFHCDAVFERCISHHHALTCLQLLEMKRIKVVNSSRAAQICGQKSLTHASLDAHRIPTPPGAVAFSMESALQAIDHIGLPVVLKPDVGSWGRQLALVKTPAEAKTILEHKLAIAQAGGRSFPTLYIQKFVEKPKNRDIRVFVIGGRTVAAIYRTSQDWITNTAQGGIASNCPLNSDLCSISERAASACGGGILAIDIFEDKKGYTLNEVNYTPEFRNSIDTTGVNIPDLMVDYVIQVASGEICDPVISSEESVV